jgi:hypothetical protein
MATTHDSAEIADTVRELAAKVDLGRIHDVVSEKSEQIQEKVGAVASQVGHAASRAKEAAPDAALAGARAAVGSARKRPAAIVAGSVVVALIGLLLVWRRATS